MLKLHTTESCMFNIIPVYISGIPLLCTQALYTMFKTEITTEGL